MKKTACSENIQLEVCGRTLVGSKGQIVIPKDVREKLGIKSGDNVTFLLKDNEALIVIPHTSLQSLMQYAQNDKNITFISQ